MATSGVEVRDIDVSTLSNAGLRRLLALLYANRFLVLATEGLTRNEYVAFARRLGEPIRLSSDERFPEIADLTNVGVDTKRERRGAAHWHTGPVLQTNGIVHHDAVFRAGAEASGETRFCDMAAAYQTLDEATKQRIEGLVVEHRHGVSVAARPGDHVPVPPRGWDRKSNGLPSAGATTPDNRNQTLYAPAGTSQGIRGMAPAPATALLQELCDHAFEDRFIAQHRHRRHDLVMWDNPTVMHCATPLAAAKAPEDTRLIHRISLRGTPPVLGEADTS